MGGRGEGGGTWGEGGGVLAEKERKSLVAARFVTTADFVTTAHFVTTADFVTNEVVTNRAGTVPFWFLLGYQYV